MFFWSKRLPAHPKSKQGSINLAFESQRMAIPKAKFIGLSSADPERYGLPRNVGIKLNEKDIARAKELMNCALYCRWPVGSIVFVATTQPGPRGFIQKRLSEGTLILCRGTVIRDLDEVHDVLRTLGPLGSLELDARCEPGVAAAAGDLVLVPLADFLLGRALRVDPQEPASVSASRARLGRSVLRR